MHETKEKHFLTNIANKTAFDKWLRVFSLCGGLVGDVEALPRGSQESAPSLPPGYASLAKGAGKGKTKKGSPMKSEPAARDEDDDPIPVGVAWAQWHIPHISVP